MSWETEPDAGTDGSNLQLHGRGAPCLGARASAPDMLAAFQRQRILPDEELRFLRFDNRNVVDGKGEVIM